MTDYALNNHPLPTSDITVGDVQFSYSTLLLWTDAERASYGIYPIIDDTIPAGKVSTGSTLEKVGNVVQRHWTLVDAPAPPVPSQVSSAQAKVALFNANLLDAAEAAIATAYKPVQIYWLNSPTFERAHPYVQGIGALLNLTDAQEDGLFTAAAAL